MILTCTVSHLDNGKWLARHTGSSTGQVEVTAPTRETCPLMKALGNGDDRTQLLFPSLNDADFGARGHKA